MEQATNMSDQTTASYDFVPSNATAIPNEYHRIFTVAFFINRYYLWLIFVVGFPGNVASIITILRMRHLGSFTLYVVMLAVMDDLSIAIKITSYHLIDKVPLGDGVCKFFFFAGAYFPTLANWVLVLMALERLLAVRYPLKVQKYLNKKRSALILFIMAFAIATLYSPILKIGQYNKNSTHCEPSNDTPGLVQAMGWINGSLAVFIPFILIALSNIFIAREIQHSFRIRRALQCISSTTFRPRCCDISTQRQILLMLFTTTLVFVLLSFPICAFKIADRHLQVDQFTVHYAAKYLCQQIAYFLVDSTHAINFYLYFLSARKFRLCFTQLSTCMEGNNRPSPL